MMRCVFNSCIQETMFSAIACLGVLNIERTMAQKGHIERYIGKGHVDRYTCQNSKADKK